MVRTGCKSCRLEAGFHFELLRRPMRRLHALTDLLFPVNSSVKQIREFHHYVFGSANSGSISSVGNALEMVLP